MNSDDLELFRQVWSVPVEPKETALPAECQEECKSPEVKEGKGKIVLESLEQNFVIDALVDKITDDCSGEGEEWQNRFNPAQLKKGKLGFAYKDQLRKLYGEVIDVFTYIPTEKVEREFKAIVMAEKSRIRRNGRQIATLLKTRIDIEKEKIRINSWIEQEHAAGRCPVHRWYKMPYKKADAEDAAAEAEEDDGE